MKSFHVTLAAGLLAAWLGSRAYANEDAPPLAPAVANLTHLHDFDFLVGDWRVHHRRLKERLVDSHEWIEFDGTLSMRKLMDGYANAGDNFFKMAGGDHRGIGLRAYDAKTGQWAVWWLDGSDPSANLDPPNKGHFENGIGTFYADDVLRGKPVRVRVIWSRITATSARWEQAFSNDGGKTWETNWISEFKRASTTEEDKSLPAQAAANVSGLHDFDLRAGQWHAHHRRLKERLADNHVWEEFDGTCSFRALMGGWANEDDNIFNMPGGVYRGVTLRSYDAKTGRWAIWWLDGRNPFGNLDPPVKGSFVNGVGTFYADDTLRGKLIRVRFIWSHITSTSAHWEQAFSPDAGKTWETNWVTDFQRAG